MGKEFDELAKALASGVSRRRALKRFAGGAVGAAFASLFTGRSADAQVTPAACRQFCQEQLRVSSGPTFGRCVAFCARCVGQGGIPEQLDLNSTPVEFICVGVNNTIH
jgi:hypothetical protein